MGLAAAQARFLGITARKNSCELKSMQIAQDKLSISQQLAKASENYQHSLDATKLVWDSEYITDGTVYDVNYDLLMTPSLLNNYSPQLLTNMRNQIILTSQYADAIGNLVVGTKYDENGNLVNASFNDYKTGGAARTEDNFKKFINALHDNGLLSQVDLDTMLKGLNGYSYEPMKGLGGGVQEMFTADAMNLATMKKFINAITDEASPYMTDLKRECELNGKQDIYNSVKRQGDLLNFKNPVNGYTTYDSSGNATTVTDASFGSMIKSAQNLGSDGKPYNIYKDVSLSDYSFNLAKLLSEEVTMTSGNADQMTDAMVKFINNMYDIMKDFYKIDEKSVDNDYLNYTMDQMCRLNGLKWDSNAHKATGSATEMDQKAYVTSDSAATHTCVVKDGDGTYKLSLSNLVKGTLTYFEKAIEGFDSAYTVKSSGDYKVTDSYYITQDPSYFYLIDNKTALDVDDHAQLLINYYNQMFNQICLNGWEVNDKVNDPENLKNMLKSAKVFTTALSEADGMFYQEAYTNNAFIAEVADKDAITRAEAEYKTQQTKLNAKEEELDIDLHMVDAELAALTTEYDTVKNLISKGVEKGFSTLGG